MNLNVNYHWDFEFQGQFKVDVPRDQKPYLALAGGILHGDLYGYLARLFRDEGALELRKRCDFRNRDNGFTTNRAIRGDDLRVVKVMDEKKGKLMMAMPDVVDYRNDVIIDLKTHYFRKPPDQGGRFITANDVSVPTPSGDRSPNEISIPDGYEDAWAELKRFVAVELNKKHESQFMRYHQAYCQATGRVPSINIYVVLYALRSTDYHDRGYGAMRKLD